MVATVIDLAGEKRARRRLERQRLVIERAVRQVAAELGADVLLDTDAVEVVTDLAIERLVGNRLFDGDIVVGDDDGDEQTA